MNLHPLEDMGHRKKVGGKLIKTGLPMNVVNHKC